MMWHPLAKGMPELLSDAASDALQHGYVIRGGDFNAKVASRSDISGSDMDFLEDSGIAFHRGMSSPRENLHGRMLIDFCMRTSLLLGTGRLLGAMTASPTYFRGSSGSRLDHVAMDRCTLARATGCTIQQDRYDSDHKPLVLGLSFSARAVTADQQGRSLLGPLVALCPSCIGMGPKRKIMFPTSVLLAQSLLSVNVRSALGTLLQLLQSWAGS